MTLSDIQQSFSSRSFDLESISLWLTGVAGIFAIIVAMWLIKSLMARRMRYLPHGKITDPKTIRAIIRQAFDQRRPFEVQVQTDDFERRPVLRCAAQNFGNETFSLEINGIKSLSPQWKGRNLSVYFRVRLGGEFTYYTFNSAIESIHSPHSGVCHITLSMPTSLDNRQKRAFLRMAPPPEFLMGAAIWHGSSMPPPETHSSLSGWPRPQLLYIPTRTEQFQILDLSAGGCRLSIASHILREFRLEFSFTEQLIIMLDLFDPEQNKRLRFWLQCRIQSIWIEHATRNMHMGIQFQAWARPREFSVGALQGNDIEWLRLSSAREVEPIGNWIMRRHLELFRDTPAD